MMTLNELISKVVDKWQKASREGRQPNFRIYIDYNTFYKIVGKINTGVMSENEYQFMNELKIMGYKVYRVDSTEPLTDVVEIE